MPGLKQSLLGMGNPLLDVIATVDQAFLDKYKIKMNNQILAEDSHQPMYEEMSGMSGVQFVPGGATQNSMRVAQWLLQVPGAVSYFGCVGKDKYSKIMEDTARKEGLNTLYQVDSSTPTGTCATAVLKGERSLVANLAAANNYKVDHVKQAEHWKLVEAARVVYSAGFFITVSPDAIKLVGQHCSEQGKTYCMNLSAPFISEVPPFKATLMEAMPFIDFLFGNETEAGAFAASEGWAEKDLPAIAQRIAAFPKASGRRCRTVVITHGKEPTVVAHNGQVQLYPVIELAPDKLVDTNGAGDAFVGGFLSQLVAGKGIPECVRAANFAAHLIIQQSGVTLPDTPAGFDWC